MQQGNKSILVIGMIIIGLLLIIVVVGTLLLIGNHNQANTSNTVSTAPTPPFTIIGTFQGTGGGQTSPFFTAGNWVLVWSCNPVIDGISSPYPLSIADESNPSSVAPTTTVVVQTTCQPGNTSGTVGVFASGEQEVLIGTADPNAPGSSDVPNAPWSVVIEVAG